MHPQQITQSWQKFLLLQNPLFNFDLQVLVQQYGDT